MFLWHNAPHINQDDYKNMQALFLGAGASFDCGLPLRWELTAEIRRWLTPERLAAYNAGWESQGQHWNHAVIDRLTELLADEDVHYEHLLKRLAQESQDAAYDFLQRDFRNAFIFLLQTVYAFLLERQAKNASYASVVLRDYQGLKNLVHLNRPLWVFTTNQDVTLELLALSLDIPIKSGFGGQTELAMGSSAQATRKLRFEQLSDVDITNQTLNFFTEGEYGINLVKLHGSLDSFLQSDLSTRVKLLPQTQQLTDYLADLVFINQVNQQLTLEQGGAITNRSLYKDAEDKLHVLERSFLSDYPYFPATENADPTPFHAVMQHQLKAIEEVIVIGYRFEESSLNNLFSQWLALDDNRRLRVVDPVTHNLPAALQTQEDKIRFLRQGALDFFLSLITNKNAYLSLLGNLQRNMRRKVRIKLLKSLTSRL
jgi:hypothetical protein